LDAGINSKFQLGPDPASKDAVRKASCWISGMQRVKKITRALTTYLFWKNIIDRALALLVLVILSPFLVIIAIIIRIDSPGNPLFRQERVGKEGIRFTVYKFRSMYIDNDDSRYKALARRYVEENITLAKEENGQDLYELLQKGRVTRAGSLLRRTNLDELPQLINVLKGDMALVGPRPDIPLAVEVYKDHHKQRLSVKQGLTGLWQISSGRRDISFDDIVRLDVDYIKRQSFFLDVKIIFLTIFQTLWPRSR
jgi:lipopolysaccharide/colanic/teichoic acid biosynthesis glycosyltransferase